MGRGSFVQNWLDPLALQPAPELNWHNSIGCIAKATSSMGWKVQYLMWVVGCIARGFWKVMLLPIWRSMDRMREKEKKRGGRGE